MPVQADDQKFTCREWCSDRNRCDPTVGEFLRDCEARDHGDTEIAHDGSLDGIGPIERHGAGRGEPVTVPP